MTVTVMLIGRKLRTCIGWTNFQLVSWARESPMHATPVNHWGTGNKNRVGTTRFHAAGKPLKNRSSVIWSVRAIHRAEVNSMNAPMVSDQPSGSMAKR